MAAKSGASTSGIERWAVRLGRLSRGWRVALSLAITLELVILISFVVDRLLIQRVVEGDLARAGVMRGGDVGEHGAAREHRRAGGDPRHPRPAPAADPPGPPSPGRDVKRVLRGGNWKSSAEACRATYRQGEATVNTDAYRYYLMGRGFFHRGHTKRYLRLAKQMFARALDIDPDYAAAHAGIADCNSHLLDAGDSSITVQEILEQSERALSLDATLAEAHASKGLALYTAGRYNDAEACFQTAHTLKPDLFEAYLFSGRNCFNLGQYLKAAEMLGKAADLKHDDFRALGIQAMCFQSLGRKEDMINAARRSLARAEAAIAERPDDADALAFGAGLLAILGETERTKDWAERASIMEPDDFYLNYNLACAYAVLGETELALDRLEQVLSPSLLRSQKEFMLHDSDLDKLRDHPRFIALIKKLRID